jgi:hypothetical protein
MVVKKFVACLGLSAMALLGTAVTADAATPAGTAGQTSCREPVGAREIFGRWVHLWLCDNGWHGQITSAAAEDQIWLDSAAGTVTGWNKVVAGQTSANSGTVGQHGGPWRACGRAGNRLDIVCTDRN